jgi:hypothetical protein
MVVDNPNVLTSMRNRLHRDAPACLQTLKVSHSSRIELSKHRSSWKQKCPGKHVRFTFDLIPCRLILQIFLADVTVPTGNSERLTSPCESDDNRPNGRSLRAYVVCYSRAIPVAGSIAS